MSRPTVAIIGASADRSKYGNKSVRAHLAQGYEVFPVNPKGGQIEGLAVYKRLADVPGGRLHRISVYVPPEVGLVLIDEIAARGCDELWLNPGAESEELVSAAQARGLEPITACSIIGVGMRPSEL
ncbi:MAG: CoA-binding protein [Planctomycetota bacterium]|nr:MAG: CoA-binding protein [Planctomycetota bacterium]